MPFVIPRCEALPLPDHQVSFRIDGIERLRWHCGTQYPRPFFYPLLGPSGISLTRIGHPGAPNHDHHRSIWFAHEKVSGVNFWTEGTKAFIRQKQWLAYQDGKDEASMAVLLGWHDGHNPKEMLEQEVVVGVRPGPDGGTFVEVQCSFKPTAEALEFAKTNFGFFAVRVAKSISEHFGGGVLTNSEGQEHEAAIFGKHAKWMDYSGPIKDDAVEGITYFDHPSNPGHPSKWHVREDGWMQASVCMDEARTTNRKQPLTLRYLLHAHGGKIDAARTEKTFKDFSALRPYAVSKAMVKHTQFVINRVQ